MATSVQGSYASRTALALCSLIFLAAPKPLPAQNCHSPATISLEQEHNIMNSLLVGHPASRGPTNAPVTLVEFVDFQCPGCRHLAEMMKELPVKQANSIRVVLRQRFFPFHPWARKAAIMSVCVGVQDSRAFWKLADFLFARQDELSVVDFEPRVLDFAKRELHLDPEKTKSCIENRGYEEALLLDQRLARKLDVRQTPTVFVNGRKYVDFMSTEDLRRAIDVAWAFARKDADRIPFRGR